MPSVKNGLFLAFLFGLLAKPALAFEFQQIDLPKEHIPFYFKTFPRVADDCRNDESCPYKEFLDQDVCWGHEPNCPMEKAFQSPECPGDHQGWVKTKETQVDTFYSQADFGYLREQMNQMKIICEPLFKDDSALECSDHLQFCRGRNIMINFTELAKEPARYKMDILKPGQIGGYCTLHEDRLKGQADHNSPLQSWSPEMRNFEKLHQRPIENNLCDVVVDRPTFIMKIDAAVNMYHHFCDFFNLYCSLHLNSSHAETFSRDVNILIWETFRYHSAFASAFKAFSEHPVNDLNMYRGKVVCFKSVVFPLLPRMIFGLYYNTPIIYGCEKSGLFKAFNQFMLHRMRVDRRDSPFYDPSFSDDYEKVRVTFLSRNTTYRKVLNEKRLLDKLRKDERFDVRTVDYNRQLPFSNQVDVTQHSDIFIGMHGAGLTHLLFLPDWAVLFEIYNCEDENCYKDLARMRGIKYMTWTNTSAMIQQDEGHHPEGGAHAKFTNYEFDPDEFVKLVNEAADHVQSHKQYQDFIQRAKTEEERLSLEGEALIKEFGELQQENWDSASEEYSDEHDEL